MAFTSRRRLALVLAAALGTGAALVAPPRFDPCVGSMLRRQRTATRGTRLRAAPPQHHLAALATAATLGLLLAAQPLLAAPESPPEQLFSVGDLHGDAVSSRRILKSLGLMGDQGEWTGGRSILVQTGDITDRGDESGQIFQALFRLQDEAPASGGKVILLMGNHELMNLQGDFRYATAADTASMADTAKGQGSWQAQRAQIFSKNGWLGRAIRERFQTVAVERKVLFVHAGVLPIFGQDSVSAGQLENKINGEVKRLLNQDADKLREEESPLLGDDGPFWTRQLALGPEGRICKEVSQTLEAFHTTRMVVGHTAQADGRVHTRCGGKLVLGDTLISRFYTGTAHPFAVEHFRDGSAEAIDVLRSKRFALPS